MDLLLFGFRLAYVDYLTSALSGRKVGGVVVFLVCYVGDGEV